MSYFSNVLEDAMTARDHMSQTELARRAESSQGQISRYLSGEVLPDHPALVKLCGVFPEKASALVVAFLLDQTPDSLRHLVRIDEPSAGKRKEPPKVTSVFERLPPRVQQVFLTAALRAEKRPEFFDLLRSTVNLTGGLENP